MVFIQGTYDKDFATAILGTNLQRIRRERLLHRCAMEMGLGKLADELYPLGRRALQILFVTLSLLGWSLTSQAALSAAQERRLIIAIRKVEGTHSRHPYGILSTHSQVKARRICMATVRRLRLEWESSPASQHRVDWLDYLADGYCPSATDPVGNQNWKNNIHKLIK